MIKLPALDQKLSPDQILVLEAFSKSCRKSILEMTTNAKSGHPGGSLSSIDYLVTLYCFIISQSGADIIVSNGHISPAVYSILAELNYIDKENVVKTFRKIGSIFEGHVTRHVPGVLYGTGPLGIGFAAAAGFALSEKFKKAPQSVYCLIGDGEVQEGEIYETLHFIAKYKLNNLITFVDYNQVQLSDSLNKIMPIDLPKTFQAAGLKTIEIDGHDYQQIWEAISKAHRSEKPSIIIGHTIMGKGVDFMEQEGQKNQATWHGKAASSEDIQQVLPQLKLAPKSQQLIKNFLSSIQWHPEKPQFTPSLQKNSIRTATPIIYSSDTLTDCRSAYGKALLDLVRANPEIVALTADLGGSVMTKFVQEQLPKQHFECGIAEQLMVSLAGGLSLKGLIPFVSTFGVFMTSRAKDQARVNDINQTNVKMVATHCGLSVGEDGPTHQAIDDMGSFLGLLNTMIIEPADPNQTDHIIRYIASHYGNFYVRMGRHKFPVITKEDGRIFFDEKYHYYYGRCDLIRDGQDITIAATGATIHEALLARQILAKNHPQLSIAIVAVSSIKKFDTALIDSITKTGRVLTVEDHNIHSGLSAMLAAYLTHQKIPLKRFETLGISHYQLSGTAAELYHAADIDAEAISRACLSIDMKI